MRVVTQIDKTLVNIFYGSATLPFKIEIEPIFKAHEHEKCLVQNKAV